MFPTNGELVRKQVEKRLGLKVIRTDGDGGVTDESLELARRWLGKLEKPLSVYLYYQEDPWEFYTYVVGGLRRALRFSGFGWGYSGKGPEGLRELITQVLGWQMPPGLPEAHVPGVWCVVDGDCFLVSLAREEVRDGDPK